jgi:glycosyltransferase involved in cell wall biosynthesis
MTSSPKIQFINSFPPPTAVWRYARLMQAAAGHDAALATVCIGSLDFRRVDRSVSSVHGDWPLPQILSSALNVAVPAVALHGLTSVCRVIGRAGGVIHYLAEDIRPWTTAGRTVVSIHGNPMATVLSEEYYTFHKGYRMLVRHNLRTYARVASCIAQSEYVRRGLQEFGYSGAISVIPPAVDPLFGPPQDREALRRRLGLPADRKILLSISSGERRKNLSVLPLVMDRLPPEYLLVRVGPPVRGALWMKGLSDPQVADLYAASDALLFPTLEEGFGLPVIEAFASALPVVSSDIPVVREVTAGNALLVDPRDPKALAIACRTAVTDGASLATSGLLRVQQFTLEKLSLRLREFYDGLAG